MQEADFLEILFENLSHESKWFLFILLEEGKPINKALLNDMANDAYSKMQSEKGQPTNELLIPSRHLLDIHTARLEGAGLVKVEKLGRIRMYSITDLGEKLIQYIAAQPKNEK
ncbi:hypothetical protein LAV72_18630 [Lysinibacillus xylanilyticus]|uniref:hypothetical protein n=1 Tax=Lysinibacillus xylanilyticus TaxID=582475 RepID=UPI002B2422E4|nr:hypothetical protein [Lysinibacillus xylanilyticus]MEB2301623.1 hypothetical protein [Lysinibacillus xylanilyticus]